MKDTTRYLQQRLSEAYNAAKGKLKGPYADKPERIRQLERHRDSLYSQIRKWERQQGIKRGRQEARLYKRYQSAKESLLFKPDKEALAAVKRFEAGK